MFLISCLFLVKNKYFEGNSDDRENAESTEKNHQHSSMLNFWSFPGGAVVKNLPASVGDTRDMGSIPELRKSPGLGDTNPLQYSCLGNLKNRGAWQAIVHWIAKSQTGLSD